MTGDPAVSDADRRRLRWRARRGLLENDLLIGRFLDRYEGVLRAQDVAALKQLLELPDNDLLDLLLSRKEPAAELDTIPIRELLGRIRSA
jgi:antitoxin CptB